MSTHCSIIVFDGDKFQSVYVHSDGYLTGAGRTLQQHYNTLETALELVKEGDISRLREKCVLPGGHSFDNPTPGYTVYYGRDRGETEVSTAIHVDMKDAIQDAQDIVYLFLMGRWLYQAANSVAFVDLKLALEAAELANSKRAKAA